MKLVDMRRFIVVGHRAVTSPDFGLNDLSGSAGRLDILTRAVNSSFFLSHEIRKDVVLYLLLLGEPSPPKSLKFVGSELKYLNPDERSTAALMRNALAKLNGDLLHPAHDALHAGNARTMRGHWLRSTPGIYVSEKDLKDLLEECRDSPLYHLKETGEDMRDVKLDMNCTFVLGDDRDLSGDEERALEHFRPKVVSLGPLSIHTEHCITLVHNEMDRTSRTEPARQI